MNRLKAAPGRFIIFATLFFIAIFVVENINHRFWLNDFRVYYSAAQAMINGTKVYDTLFALGSGYYKYSPFTSLLILPFIFFSYPVAAVLQFIFLCFSIIAVFIVASHILNRYVFNGKPENENLFLSLAFFCVVNHLVRELHLGNINMLLLFLLCLSLLFMLNKKTILAGIMLAVVIITKPFFVLLFFPLLMHREFKTIFSSSVSLLLFVVNPAILTGFPKNIELHRDWIRTMLEHNASFPSNNTIENLVRVYVDPGLPGNFQYAVMLLACIGYFMFYYRSKKLIKGKTEQSKLRVSNFVLEWFAWIAAMPLIFKTDTQHFLLSLPLILFLLRRITMAKKYAWTICFIILMCIYGANSSDLLGKVLSLKMDKSGILGLSNIIIIVWTLVTYVKLCKERPDVPSPWFETQSVVAR